MCVPCLFIVVIMGYLASLVENSESICVNAKIDIEILDGLKSLTSKKRLIL